MKLSSAEAVHLMELAICTSYQCGETPALVSKGLAVTGKSRFAEWAKITPDGLALVKSWPIEKRVKLEGDVVNQCVAPALAKLEQELGKKPGRRERAAPGVLAAEKGEQPSMPATRRRTSAPSPLPGAASVAVVSPAPSSVSGRQPRPHAEARISAPRGRPETVPNAVRITLGSKVTYYPLSNWDSIKHASKQRCVTKNKFYRPLPLSAAANDRTCE